MTKTTTQKPRATKHFTVRLRGTIVKRTDLQEEAEKKIEDLKKKNEEEFSLTDNEKGTKTTWSKEYWQQNYRVEVSKVGA